jgi:hypothetical protein
MKLNLFYDKRGSVVDPILSSAYILKIAVTIFICLTVWVSFQAVMSSIVSGKSSETVINSALSILTEAYFSFDYMFPLIVGGLMLISIIFAFKTGTNIIWGILSIIVWGITILLATVFTNVYISVSNQFPILVASMSIMDMIMINLRWIVLFWLAIICAVMFRKNNQEDEASEMSRRVYGR